MATKIDSADKAFEAATRDTATKPVAVPAASSPAPVAASTAAPKAAAKKTVVKKTAPKKTAAKPTIKAATKPVATPAKGYKIMNDTVKKFADETKARAENISADFNARAKEAVAKSSKLAEEATAFNKANVEAMVEASKIAAKNAEVLGQEAVAFGRKSFEDASVAIKGYTAVKSPTEFFKLYAENSKKAFDAAVAQTSKTSEMVVKMTNESFAPISNRMSVISSKMKAA